MQEMIKADLSWSGRERKCVFLNTRGERFACCSGVSGVDNDDDARAVAVVDWDHDGDLDLWFANRTGPRLRFLRNDIGNGQGFVSFRLEGKRANRDGVGARLELYTERGKRIQTSRSGEGFMAQSSRWIHFGLCGAKRIERVVVRWPGGAEESYGDLVPDGRYRLVEGTGRAVAWTPPARTVALVASTPVAPAVPSAARVVLAARPPLPRLAYDDFQGTSRPLVPEDEKPLLVNLWASWCAPCIGELQDFEAHRAQFDARGLRVVALSCDRPEARSEAAEIFATMQLGFSGGYADERLVDIFETLFKVQIDKQDPIGLPTSVLVDGRNRLAIIYRGAVRAETLLSDLEILPLEGKALRAAACPFPGIWYSKPATPPLDKLARHFLFFEMPEVALEFLSGEYRSMVPEYGSVAPVDYLLRGNVYIQNAELLVKRGAEAEANRRYEHARECFEKAVAERPKSGEAANNLGVALTKLGRYDEALEAYLVALPSHPLPGVVHANLMKIYRHQGRLEPAVAELNAALRYQPDDLELMEQLPPLLIPLKRTDEARSCFEEIIRRDGKRIAARLDLATLHLTQRNFAAAESLLLETAAIAPENPLVHLGLGRAALNQEKLSEAERHYESATRLDPENFDAHKELAVVYSKTRQVAEALASVERAHALRPKDADTLWHCAALHLALGNREGALGYQKLLLEVDPARAAELESKIGGRGK